MPLSYTLNMKKIYTSLLLMPLCSFVFSQKQGAELTEFIAGAKEKALVKENTDQIMEGYFNNADLVANKLLEINSASYNYNYRKGYIYFMLNRNPKSVISYLSKGTGKTTKNYDVYSKKNKASVDVFYYLGVSYQNIEKIDSAIYYFELFNKKSSKKSSLLENSKLRLIQCGNAKKQIQFPNKDVVVRNLGPVINSQYPEYSSIISLDGSVLFFTSKQPWGGDTSVNYVSPEDGQYPDDIYVSYLEGSSWTKPKRLSLNTPQNNEATISINIGQRRIYTYSDSTGRGDIYYSDFENNDFSQPKFLETQGINTEKFWEPSIYFTEDGKTVYFTSDREGGYGGRDIYFCEKQSNGSWSEPKNMGPAINTKYDEDAPFVSVDGKTFYYASNNEKSMGGFDIFYAKKGANGSFSEGQPFGYPLNSTGDDIYYTSTIDGYKGYITSSREDSFGEKDIYEIENNYLGIENTRFAVIALKTSDNSKLPEDVKVRFLCETCTEKSEIVYPRLRDGVAINSLEPCKEYIIEYLIGAEEKVMKRDTVKTDCDSPRQEIKKEYTIDVPNKKIAGEKDEEKTPVVSEQPMAEYKKSFGYNKNIVTTSEKDFKNVLKEVKSLLTKENTVKIIFEIYASASTVPTKTYETNENLAQLRANNMMKTLLKEFDADSKLLSRINVVIKEAAVKGPSYDNDARDTEKYAPYQYVEIKVIKQ